MTEENPGNGSAAPESTLPVKRRRGRPRKDESLSHGENSSSLPASDGTKKKRHDKSDSTGNDDSAFVGQMVSGILDGSFDAGYLLTVKVGNTDTVMRGLVFDPRLSVPISSENDIAPHVKMFKRSEIPLPIPAQPLSQAPPIVGQKELSYELPTNLHECNVTVLQPQESVRGMQRETNHAFLQASQPSSSQSKDKTKTAAVPPKGLPDGADQAARTAPLAQTSKTGRRKSDHITKNGVILLPYYPVPSVVAQASQSEVKDQPKTEDFTAALAGNITPIQSGLPNGAAVPEDTKLKAETEPSAEIQQGNEDGKELPSVMEQPPGIQTPFFTPPIPDTMLKVGTSAELDCTLPPPAEPFQSVSQSLEMLLEKNVNPLGDFPSAGMQDLMQPKAKILEGANLSASSTGAVEVPITDLHFGFISNHPMGPYGATEHEIPNPNPPAFTPKDTT